MPIEMFYGPTGNEGMTSSIRGKNAASESVTVQGQPLASILAKDEVINSRLLKMDIEGAEAEALEGLSPILGTFPDDAEFIVEIIPEVLGSEKLGYIFELFRSQGFFAYFLET